jgi:hypothetical protein
MIPSLGLLTSILTGLVTKLGINQLEKHGYMPQSTYVTKVLKALEKDDLDEAIRNYRLAVAKKRSTHHTELAHEIISQAIALRIAKLQARIDQLAETLHPPVLSLRYWRNLLPRHRSTLEVLREEAVGCQEAIAVLAHLQNQLELDN